MQCDKCNGNHQHSLGAEAIDDRAEHQRHTGARQAHDGNELRPLRCREAKQVDCRDGHQSVTVAANEAVEDHDPHQDQADASPQYLVQTLRQASERSTCLPVSDRVAGAPRQAALATTFHRQHESEQDNRLHARGGNRGDREADFDQHDAGHCRRHTPADRLTEYHEAIQAALFIDGRDLDCHAVHRDILRRRKHIDEETEHHQQANLLGRIVDEDQAEKRQRHAKLRTDHPGPSSAHGQELEPIHQWTGQELEGPRQNDDGEEGRNLAGADPLTGKPRGHGNVHQAVGNALCKVHGRARCVTHAGAFNENPVYSHFYCPDPRDRPWYLVGRDLASLRIAGLRYDCSTGRSAT